MAHSLEQISRVSPLQRFFGMIGSLRLLTRLELSTMVALSALTGYLFAGGSWSWPVLQVLGGTGLLAGGSSALNQWQERDLDRRMSRTRHRPLPMAHLSGKTVILLALIQIISGLLLLGQLSETSVPVLGALAVLWYNAVYTPLKRITAFAALPGALCGALPPLIGWTAAGADPLAFEALILAGTLFVWQIPHTWLLLCCYREDLRRSGLPDLFRTIPTERLLRINNCWIVALFVCYLLFPLFGFTHHLYATASLLCGLLFLSVLLVGARFNSIRETAGRRFHLINLSMALLLTVLIMDRVLT